MSRIPSPEVEAPFGSYGPLPERVYELLENPHLTYGVRLEDRNSDGDFTDEGENQGAFVPTFSTVWTF